MIHQDFIEERETLPVEGGEGIELYKKVKALRTNVFPLLH